MAPTPRPSRRTCSLLALLATLLLAGCGQKGDLYLPDAPPSATEQEEEEAT